MAFFSGLTWYQRIPLGRPLSHIEGDTNVQNMIDISKSIVVGPGDGCLSIEQLCTTSEANGKFSVAVGDNNIVNGDNSTIIGGVGNTVLMGVTGSTILGCNNLTATTNDTLYVCNLKIGGEQIISGSTTVNGPTFINNVLNITGDTFVGGDLTVSGDTNSLGALSACNGFYVSEISPCGDDIDLSATTFNIYSETNINDNLTVSGVTTLEQDLIVEGDLSLEQNLNVTGDTVINGDTELIGDLTACTGSLFVETIEDCGSGVTINSDLCIHGTLSASTIIGDTLGLTNLEVVGTTNLLGNVSACTVIYLNEIEACDDDNVTIIDNLIVSGNTTVGSDSTVLNNSTIGGNLNVVGDITGNTGTINTFNSTDGDITNLYSEDIDVCDLSAKTATIDTLFGGDVTSNTLTVTGDTSLTDYVTTSVVQSTLPISTLSDFMFTDVNKVANQPPFISYTGEPIIAVKSLTSSTNLLSVDGALSASTGVHTDYIHTESVLNLNDIVAIDNTEINQYQGEDTAGDDYFYSGGTVTVNGNLFMAPGTIIRSEKFASFSPLNLNGVLYADDDADDGEGLVWATSDVQVTSGNTLYVDTIHTNDINPMVINDILTIDGGGHPGHFTGGETVSITGDLAVTGDTILTGDLTITGDTTVDGVLNATSGACITGDTKILGVLHIDGSLNVTGDAFIEAETMTACTGVWAQEFTPCTGGAFTFNGQIVTSGLTTPFLNTSGITINGGEIFQLFDDRYLFKTGDTVTSGGTLVSPFLSANTTTSNTIDGTNVNVSNNLDVDGVTTLDDVTIDGTLSACSTVFLSTVEACDGNEVTFNDNINVVDTILSNGIDIDNIYNKISTFNSHSGDTNNPHEVNISGLTDFTPGLVGGVQDGELIGWVASAGTWTNIDVSFVCELIPDFLELMDTHSGNTNNPHQTSLENLIDTDVTGSSLNDVIVYSGGSWISTGINSLVNDTDNFVSGGTFNPSTTSIDYVGTDAMTTFSTQLSGLTNPIYGAITAHTSDISNPHDTSLVNLTDTNVSGIMNGQVLTYVGGVWVNTNAGAGGDTFVLSGGTVNGDVIIDDDLTVNGNTTLSGLTADTLTVGDTIITGSLSACNDTVYFNEIDSCEPSGITINSDVVIPSGSTLTVCEGVTLNNINHCDGTGGTITVNADLQFGNTPGGVGASVFKSYAEVYIFDDNTLSTDIPNAGIFSEAIINIPDTSFNKGLCNNFIVSNENVTFSGETNKGPRLQYTGETTFHVTLTIGMESTTNRSFIFFMKKNGTDKLNNIYMPTHVPGDDIVTLSMNGSVSLSNNDYLELWVSSSDATQVNIRIGNITVAQI